MELGRPEKRASAQIQAELGSWERLRSFEVVKKLAEWAILNP